ncbi:hypothetical protein MFRU_007g02340 [Monilinia fructicola]|uniref:Cell wall protein n=1 Tax=Monilinia fructicola TaxID=38448 RepID=A0A5M9JC03_MONFR|nr:hypothetical protein EYC84_010202 [Monilinia fructicola]KAG4032327.1 hypothetical protein MFRU_007g02340 [Monilinia fructicola]
MYTQLLTLAGLCAAVLAQPGPQVAKRQDADVSAIAASLSSLSSALAINPSIAAELAGIPSSVQALQSNAAGISQLASEFLHSGPPAWYSSLSPDAKSYVLEDGAARASLLDGVYSLESLLSAATATATATATAAAIATTTAAPVTTGIINGTTATLVPVGTGALTLASSTLGAGGNSTVTTRKLSSTSEAKSTGEATTKTAAGKTSEPSPITSSSKAGAAQVTGAVGLGLVGLVGLVWAL